MRQNITDALKHTCKPLKEGTKYTPSESSTLLAMASVSFTSEKSSVRQAPKKLHYNYRIATISS